VHAVERAFGAERGGELCRVSRAVIGGLLSMNKRSGLRVFSASRASRASRALLVSLALTSALAFEAAGCKKRVNQAQCEELLDRYATLVVHEKLKDAPPEKLKAEQARERDEARNDDDFKNCTAELSADDYACAMKAPTADTMEKCLE
jgi:hypothetical protein